MAKKEVKTDLWVAAQLDECKIHFDAQGSDVKEINEALKTASKRGTGNAGYPEYTAVIGDFVLVIEDKADMDKQIKLTDSGIIDTSVKAVTDYAVNGAYFYAKHIAQNTAFKKVFAVGVSGDAKHHVITPLWVDDREGYKQLPDIESFVSFSEQNINEYYTRYVLEEATDIEKTTEQILKDAAELHEYLRTYGTLKDQDKPLVVAGILLALDEIEFGGFAISSLTGDQLAGNRDGHKLFGYDVDRSTKKYIPDPNTAPFVQWAFTEYASGKPLKTIAEEMNAQGLRTPRNAKFSVNMLNKMLKNRAYIGEYHHGDITVAGGMPVLVDEATFDRAQRRFAENKRKGSQRAHGMDGSDAPRYWLTGKLYCGECGSTMQGVSGTSKTGRTYYYYYCSAQRRKECHLHKARKRDLEDMVLFALHNIVDDEENVTALALDAAEYYEKSHDDTAYLEALEAKRREVEKSLANLVKVIERGVVSDTVTERLTQLEEQKSALNDAIGTENVRVSLCEDRHSIQAYFDKFLHADVNDPEIRDQVFEYFVDKVYLYDDKLVVSMWFSEDDRQEITWRDWFSLDEYWTDESPFVKGGGVEFDCFPFSSTKDN